MTIGEAIDFLKFYNGSSILTLHPGASDELLDELEAKYCITLPSDFREFYRFTDGFEVDEDIFNMIPLREIIENKDKDEPIWIAEYMIYSDMWGLQINYGNPDDYSIFNINAQGEKIALTNSLAEFIENFFIGGVFETGGLYHWADVIEAKLHGQTPANKIDCQLSIFHECLKLDLVSECRVIDWAKWIISTEGNTYDLLINVSLSQNREELTTILSPLITLDGVLRVRIIFGQIYLKLLTNSIEAPRALYLLNEFVNEADLTSYEKTEIQYLIRIWKKWRIQHFKILRKPLEERTRHFFSNYSRFNLNNSYDWENINTQVIEKFSSNN